MKILCVGATSENLQVLAAAARASGHEMAGARSGIEGLRVLEKQPVDLIVSATAMPEMNGFRFCHEVRNRGKARMIPFVFYTAIAASKEDKARGLALGASRFIAGPVEPAQLIAICEDVVKAGAHGNIPAARREMPVEKEDPGIRQESLIRKLERKVEQLELAAGDLRAALAQKEAETARRQHVEHSLRHSEERFRLVWENALDGMRLTNAEGTIERVNPAFAAMFAKTAEELEGKSFGDCYTSYSAQASRETYAKEFAAGVDLHFEEEIERWDGVLRWFEGSRSFIESSTESFMLTIFRDITERKAAEEERAQLETQLRHAQKLESLGRLAGGIAHDFNNLLSVILFYGESSLKEAGENERRSGFATEILRAARESVGLTRQLVAFSRQMDFDPTPVDLNEIVSGSSRMLAPLVREGVQVVMNLSARPARILADESQIMRVLMNLVVNADDAMDNGGMLTLATEVREAKGKTCVLLTVSDTGKGMDASTRSMIFEPFYTTKGEGKGSGLGLSTVHGIVARLNGTIDVASEPGLGSTFTICFPALADECCGNSAPHAAEDAGLHGHETVLVVDDHDAVRSITARSLRRYGYTVVDAGSGAAALELAERHAGPIDVLLSDVRMPEMSGPELAHRIKPFRPEIRVLMLSGDMGRETEDSGQEFASLLKPVPAERLAAKVREILDAGRQ